MNLYRILFEHVAPKDTKEGIETYLIAKNEEKVYQYINELQMNAWDERANDGDTVTMYDDDTDKYTYLPYKEAIMERCGELFFDDRDYSDAYYGITNYGWELVCEHVGDAFDEIEDVGIAIRYE